MEIEQGRKARIYYLLFMILLILLTCNFILRNYLEQSHTYLVDYFTTHYVKTLPVIYGMPWYKMFLPLREWTGAWNTTGLFLIPPLTKAVGSFQTLYYLLNALFISVAFFLSWFAFRSVILTTTFSICAAFTTYNYYIYTAAGSIDQYLIISYLLCFLFSLYRLFQEGANRRLWWSLWSVSLLVYVISYEGWLDFLFVSLIFSVFYLLGTWRAGDKERFFRWLKIQVILILVAIVYIEIKTHLGYGQQAGSESDVVLNYGFRYSVLAFEDLISNLFTFFYIVITTFIPPQLTFSNSILLYGGKTLIALQNGYFSQSNHLVILNALFLWRFYAGVALTLFVMLICKVAKRVVCSISCRNCLFLFFMLMVLFPSFTHSIVKWRAFNALPVVAYHLYLGEAGLMLLIAYCSRLIYNHVSCKRIAWLLIILIWLDIIFCAFARPPFLNFCIHYLHVSYLPVKGAPAPWSELKMLI